MFLALAVILAAAAPAAAEPQPTRIVGSLELCADGRILRPANPAADRRCARPPATIRTRAR
ncbi:MAG: hypothetical protein AB7P02_17325 [Alphaproteobacteria bacterium]